MTFLYPQFLLLSLLFVPLYWAWRRRGASLPHTQLELHRGLRSSWFQWLMVATLALGWIAGCVSLARPLRAQHSERYVVETRDFVIQTDISGSMNDPMPAAVSNASGAPPPGQQRAYITRIEAAEQAVIEFIARREGDRVALLLFSDVTFYNWPLSGDLQVVARRAQGLRRYVGGGTNFDAEDGALQGAIDHIREMSRAHTRVLILVTDGEADIDDERSQVLVRELREENIKLYVLGVGDGWQRQSPMTQPLRQLVQSVQGTIIVVGNEAEMRSGFASIDALERSQVELLRSTQYEEMYAQFAGLALVCLSVYIGLCLLAGRET